MANKFGWTKDILIHQIDTKAFERAMLNQSNFDKAKIKVKIVSKERKTFQFKIGAALDIVFEDIDKNTIYNLLNLTNNILTKV